MPAPSRRSVLITRPEPGGSETARRIRARGLLPVLAPLLRVQALTPRLPDRAAVQAVLVTSGSAIVGLAGMDRSCPLLAVGKATAERARAAGFTQVCSAEGDAQDLAALACRRLDPEAGKLLLVCGSGHSLPLAASLRRAGFRVLRRTVYAVEPVPALPADAVAALQTDRLLAVLFFSATAARQFAFLMKAADLKNSLPGITALAISAPAGVAVSHLPWRDVLIAARPNQDELLTLLA